jgi:hypothetical protein
MISGTLAPFGTLPLSVVRRALVWLKPFPTARLVRVFLRDPTRLTRAVTIAENRSVAPRAHPSPLKAKSLVAGRAKTTNTRAPFAAQRRPRGRLKGSPPTSTMTSMTATIPSITERPLPRTTTYRTLRC